MYTIWSMQRAGRPRRAIVVMVAVFALTVAAAAYLADSRSRAQRIELGQAVTGRDGLISLRGPKDWRRIDLQLLPRFDIPPSLALAENPGEAPGTGRLLFVFDAGKDRFGLFAGLRPLTSWGDIQVTPPPATAVIGDLLGWHLSGSLSLSQKARGRWGWNACSVVDPLGNATTVALMRPSRSHRGDADALREICKTVSWSRVRVSADGREVFELTGMRITPPPTARFVWSASETPGSIMLAAGPTAEYPWSIEIRRSCAPRGTDAEALYRKMLIEWNTTLETNTSVQQARFGDNQVWYGSSPTAGETVELRWLIRTPDGVLAWLRGLADGHAAKDVREVFEKIAASFQAELPSFDYEAAVRRGAALIERLKRDGLAASWAQPTSYWLLSPDRNASRIGGTYEQRRLAEGQDGAWYMGDSKEETFWWRPNRPILIFRTATAYRVRQDGGAFVYDYRMEVPGLGQGGMTVSVQEEGAPGAGKITRTVTMQGQSEKATLETPDNYCPDPLLDLALLVVARSGKGGQPVILSHTGLDPRRIGWLKLTPLGSEEIDAGGQKVAAVGARAEGAIGGLLLDIWFSRGGEVLSVRYGHGILALRAASEGEVRRQLPEFYGRVRRRH